MTPFLKWPGGKRWFVQQFADLLPRTFKRYFEPFLGSGSVYFHLKPRDAVLSDSNSHLIDAYRGIQSDWKRVRKVLARHHRNHSDRYYYKVRDRIPDDLVDRACRMIYLNRTCFNGIYRANKKGEFNVPRGDRDQVLRDTDDFESLAELLSNTEIRHADFEEIIDESRSGDFVFADPPYTVRHNLNGFVRYNETLFSWSDQERLARSLNRARRRGALIVSTNANHASIKSLYSTQSFAIRSISRFSAVSADTDSRGQFTELLITANM